jgi:hypothetical protein
MEGDRNDARVYDKSYYSGYMHHKDAPKTRRQIAEHDAKVKAMLDAARADAGIAWDETATAHVCKMIPRERK